MDVFLLGTGTSIPVEGHSPAGLVVKAHGRNLLFDIGPGTLGRLHLAGLSCGEIEHLLLTHLHPDHTLDLATLLLVFNYAPNAQRTATFPITGCRGLRDFLTRMVDLYPEIAPVAFDLQLREVQENEFSIGKVNIKSALTGHTPESVGFRVDDGSHTMVYSGDAGARGDLVTLAKGADLLVSECSFPAGWPTEDHLNADSLGEIAQSAGVGSLLVVHTYPPALAVDLAAQIRQHFRGEVRIGMDGMHVSL